jgi:hypothetical protein
MAARGPDPLLVTLAEELRAMREQCGLSLRQLEQLTFTSDSALSRHLAGRSLPPWSVVEALCRCSDRDPAELRVVWEGARQGQVRRRRRSKAAAVTRDVVPEPVVAEPVTAESAGPERIEPVPVARGGSGPASAPAAADPAEPAGTRSARWGPRRRRPGMLLAAGIAAAVLGVAAAAAVAGLRDAEDPVASRPPRPVLPTGTVAWWPLDEASGLTARDASGHGADARLNGTVAWNAPAGEPGASFDGEGNISTADPVVRTDESFSVAAWVLLTDTREWATAVSQDGRSGSGFFLQYSLDEETWAFATLRADARVLPALRAVAGGPARIGAWTHLAGVYDADAGTLALYVDGRLSATAPRPTVWSADGPLRIGRGQFAAQPSDHWRGEIRDVVVVQRAIAAQEVGALARQQ